MNKEKLRLIVQNLESLVECLKSEICSDVESTDIQEFKPLPYEQISQYISDYDEVFYDDEV
jgi:hypothetical protein